MFMCMSVCQSNDSNDVDVHAVHVVKVVCTIKATAFVGVSCSVVIDNIHLGVVYVAVVVAAAATGACGSSLPLGAIP